MHTSVHMCDMGHPTDVAGGPTHVHTYVCAQVQQAAPSRDMCGVEHIRVLCNYVAQLCTQVCTTSTRMCCKAGQKVQEIRMLAGLISVVYY